MGRIPDEVLATNILPRLPVKTISRFRCVSKDWCNLFETPCFIKQHLNHSIENDNDALMIRALTVSPALSTLFSVKDVDSLISNEYIPRLKCHELNFRVSHYLWGSCNGLVCILTSGYCSDSELCIYNPSTKKYKKLPTPTICGEKIFDHSTLWGYGFGYDSKVEDYKLVVMKNVCGVSGVAVYTLGTNSWKDLQNFTSLPPVHGKHGHGVLANETIHWLDDSTQKNWGILSFDLRNETFQQVRLPKPLDHAHRCEARMCGFEGTLCLIVRKDRFYQDIWVQKEYGVSDSWTKQFAFRQEVLGIIFVQPLKSFKNGEILMLQDDYLVLYEPKTESIRTLNFGGNPRDWVYGAEIYVQSLVSVGSDAEIYTGNNISEAASTSEALKRTRDAVIQNRSQDEVAVSRNVRRRTRY